MKKKQIRIIVFCLLAVMIVSSIMVYPNYAYGRDNEKVAIKSNNGKYLSAENGGGSKLTATRDKVGEWETFEIIDLGKGYIALESINGKYVSATKDGKEIYVDSDEINKREIFQLIKLDNNKVAFKTYNKTYICAENGGGGKVVDDRTKIGAWETFELVNVEKINNDKLTLSAISNDKNVTLSWTKPINSRGVIGYNLYRGTTSGKQSNTPITDFPIEGNSYTDNNLNSGTTYYYVVKAVYRDKTLGASSNEVSVLLKSRIVLSATTREDGIILSWNKPSDLSNIVGYNLYRGTTSGKQSSTPITDFPILETSYKDKNIENNTKYYYILKVVYKDKTLGNASNEVSVKSGLDYTKIVLEVGSKYMIVNGREEEIDPGKGTRVIINNGRTFLPIRAVIEAMGGEVEWDQSDKKVSIYLNDNKINLWIGDKTARVNGSYIESDVAPYISDSGRTMLPLRFIVENLDCEVDWDGITKTVTIKSEY